MPIPNWEKLMLPILKLMQQEKDCKRTEMFEMLKPQFTKEELEETVASGEKNKLFDFQKQLKQNRFLFYCNMVLKN